MQNQMVRCKNTHFHFIKLNEDLFSRKGSLVLVQCFMLEKKVSEMDLKLNMAKCDHYQ